MQMMDMKLPKKNKKEMMEGAAISSADDQDRYPYGLRLRFENEQFDKIDSLSQLNVGDKVTIQATGMVIECRQSERQGNERDRSCEVQITNVGVEGGKKPSQMTNDELRKMS